MKLYNFEIDLQRFEVTVPASSEEEARKLLWWALPYLDLNQVSFDGGKTPSLQKIEEGDIGNATPLVNGFDWEIVKEEYEKVGVDEEYC